MVRNSKDGNKYHFYLGPIQTLSLIVSNELHLQIEMVKYLQPVFRTFV